jgi:hypothetical protein
VARPSRSSCRWPPRLTRDPKAGFIPAVPSAHFSTTRRQERHSGNPIRGKISRPVGEADRPMQSISPILAALARRRNRQVPSHKLGLAPVQTADRAFRGTPCSNRVDNRAGKQVSTERCRMHVARAVSEVDDQKARGARKATSPHLRPALPAMAKNLITNRANTPLRTWFERKQVPGSVPDHDHAARDDGRASYGRLRVVAPDDIAVLG